MAHAGPKADWETAEGCRQRTEWSKRAGWLQWVVLPRRQGASWCFDDAGLVAVGAYLVLYLLYMSWLGSLAWAS